MENAAYHFIDIDNHVIEIIAETQEEAFGEYLWHYALDPKALVHVVDNGKGRTDYVFEEETCQIEQRPGHRAYSTYWTDPYMFYTGFEAIDN